MECVGYLELGKIYGGRGFQIESQASEKDQIHISLLILFIMFLFNRCTNFNGLIRIFIINIGFYLYNLNIWLE